MRTSTLAILSLVTVSQIGCNHGTNVEPLHRPRPGSTPSTKPNDKAPSPAPSAPTSVEPTPAAKSAAAPPAAAPGAPSSQSVPAPTPAAPASDAKPTAPKVPATKPAQQSTSPVTPEAPPAPTKPLVTAQMWCHLQPDAAGTGFVVTRYTFTGGGQASMTTDQLLVLVDQPPVLTRIGTNDRYTVVTSASVTKAPTRHTVEVLDGDVAMATPEFTSQNDLLTKLDQTNANLEDGEDQVGLNGGVRVTYSDPITGAKDVVAFPCAEYSKSFLKVAGQPPAAKAEPKAPPTAAKPAPVTTTPPKAAEAKPAVDPMTKVDVSKLAAPFTPYDVNRMGLEGSRWCSWVKEKDDVKVGVLQFLTQGKVVVTRFLRSQLEADVYDNLGLANITKGPLRQTNVTAVDGSRVQVADGRGFRLIDDKNEVRVMVADQAPDAVPPAADAEVFYQCLPDLIPGRTAALKRNLRVYMELRERRARE